MFNMISGVVNTFPVKNTLKFISITTQPNDEHDSRPNPFAIKGCWKQLREIMNSSKRSTVYCLHSNVECLSTGITILVEGHHMYLWISGTLCTRIVNNYFWCGIQLKYCIVWYLDYKFWWEDYHTSVYDNNNRIFVTMMYVQ